MKYEKAIKISKKLAFTKNHWWMTMSFNLA
jgi:hypothetical protein